MAFLRLPKSALSPVQKKPCIEYTTKESDICFKCASGHPKQCRFKDLRKFQYNKETKEITQIDFVRVYSRPLNYDYELSLDPHSILTVEEAMDMIEYTYPVIMSMLLAKLQRFQEQKDLKNTQSECNDANCNVEKDYGKRFTRDNHIDAKHIRAMIIDLDRLKHNWNLSEKTSATSTIHDLCSAEDVKSECDLAKVRHDALQPQLLVLEDVNDNDKAFQFLSAKGQPFVIECQDSVDPAIWEALPETLAERFGDGDLGGTIKNAVTGETIETTSVKEFFEGLQLGTRRDTPLTIADFPDADSELEHIIPDVLKHVYKALPFKRHILPNGALNLVSAIHPRMNIPRPDMRPRFCVNDGTLDDRAITPIRTELADLANICLLSKAPYSEEDIGNRVDFLKPLFGNIDAESVRNNNYAALWFVFLREDYGPLCDFLRNKYPHVAAKKQDPIQDGIYSLTVRDLAELEAQHGIRPIIFLQRLGDVVIVPANLPYQVLNISSCVRVTLDFVSHTTCSRAVEHLLQHVQPAEEGREDKISLPRIIYHATERAARTLHSANELRPAILEEKRLKGDILEKKRETKKIRRETEELKRELQLLREKEQLFREKVRLFESGQCARAEPPPAKEASAKSTIPAPSKRKVGRPAKKRAGKRKASKQAEAAAPLVSATAVSGTSEDEQDYQQTRISAPVPSASQSVPPQTSDSADRE